MKRGDVLRALSLGASLAALAGSVSAQTRRVEGPFVHPASGMVLPESVGEFRRFRETPGVENAASAGYGYEGLEGRIAATFTVFLPPDNPDFCRDYIATEKEALLSSHPDVQSLQPRDAPAIDGFSTIAGVAGRYEYQPIPGGPLFRSERYYYCNVAGKWVVQYDFAYPADFDAGPEIGSFFHDLKVTIPPSP